MMLRVGPHTTPSQCCSSVPIGEVPPSHANNRGSIFLQSKSPRLPCAVGRDGTVLEISPDRARPESLPPSLPSWLPSTLSSSLSLSPSPSLSLSPSPSLSPS